jgi:hypothetical protein
MTDRVGRLASIRRVDWRFLLPATAFGTVAVVGHLDEAVLAGLERVAGRVVGPGGDDRPADEPPPALVVTIAATRSVLEAALRRVPAGGWIYTGAGPRGARGTASLREVAAALRSAGFVDVRRSWHWPSEAAALEIVSLDDTRAVRLTLDRRRSGHAARLKATVAGVALRLHLLERIVPGWSVVGRRPGGEEAETGASALDPVRASVPDGGGAGAGVVLLTPRFLASRHVIGLVLRPADGGLAAVAKLARLPDDDGGIRREAQALRRAGDLGVSGVPEVRAFRTAPDPVLVESALDGVVIAGTELRAGPVAAMAEIEAWTRSLAGGPGRHEVPLRTLWAPALERVAAEVVSDTSSVSLAIAQLAERTATILGAFDDEAVPTVLEHGDLAPPNLQRLRDGRLGVVDWEVADLEGLPLGDLLFFAAFLVGERPGDGAPSAPITLPPDLHSAIEQQAASLGIDPSLIPALRLAMWTRWADRQLARFVDRAIPLEDRLPARHLRSWTTAVGDMEAPG